MFTWEWLYSLSVENKFYISLIFLFLKVIVFYLVYLLVSSLIFLFGFSQDANYLSFIDERLRLLDSMLDFLFIIFIIVFSMGMCIEFFKKASKVANRWWFNYIVSIITLFSSVIIYKFSKYQSTYFINQVTKIDPSYFPAAEDILSAFFFIPYMLLTIIVLLSIWMIVIFIQFIFFKVKNESGSILKSLSASLFQSQGKGSLPIFASKIIGIKGLTAFFFVSIEAFRYEDAAFGYAKHWLVKSEFLSQSHCENVKKPERAATLDRGYIAIYSPDNKPQFRIEKCKI